MTVTDEQVVAAIRREVEIQGDLLSPKERMRRVLEAAAQAAPPPEPVPERYWDPVHGFTASPPPTAALGEYETIARKLENFADFEASANPLCREAAAAIRKLTAERDEARQWHSDMTTVAVKRGNRAEEAEARVAALEDVLSYCDGDCKRLAAVAKE